MVFGVSDKDMDVATVTEVGVEVPQIGAYFKIETSWDRGMIGLYIFFVAAKEKGLQLGYATTEW